MTTRIESELRTKGTLAEAIEALGCVPLDRIRMSPPPGTATEADVIAERAKPERRLCELIDGILVEKPMSTPESIIASEINHRLRAHVEVDDLGVVIGEAGMLRLDEGLIRMPDVSFIPWSNIPGEEIDLNTPVAGLVPDLAVEVLSKSNTPAEIKRKLKDYFFHGTRLAWVIDPRKQTAKVYTSPTKSKAIDKHGTLDGAPVLPGFTLRLADILSITRRRTKPA